MSRSQFYKSKVWNDVRRYIWMKQSCLCARCNSPVYVDGISEWIPKENRIKGIVHHIEYLNDNNYIDDNISLNEDNLEGLCIDCHNKEHFSTGALKSEYIFDDEGNIIPKYSPR